MEYRIDQRTKDRISVIGLGTACLSEASEEEAMEALNLAHRGGINYIDLAAAGAECFTYCGKYFEKKRGERDVSDPLRGRVFYRKIRVDDRTGQSKALS